MKIYTKTGDHGATSNIRGKRVLKADKQICANGTVDELNSFLGLLLAELEDISLQEKVERVQRELMRLGVDITYGSKLPPSKKFLINEATVSLLENEIDEFENSLPNLTNFILPGGSRQGAIAHVCRNVCRRAERDLVAFHQEENCNEWCLSYINRLSDWLFVLARTVNIKASKPEKDMKFE